MDEMRKLINLMESFDDSIEEYEPEQVDFSGNSVFDAFSDLPSNSPQRPVEVSPEEYVFLGHDDEEYTIFFSDDDFEIFNSDGMLVVDSKRFANPIQALRNRIYSS